MLKKIGFAFGSITAFYLFIWFTTFEGHQQIRFFCYHFKLCYPLSQLLENRQLSRAQSLTSIFDPFFLLIPASNSSLPIYKLKVKTQDYQTILDELPQPYSTQFKTSLSLKKSKVPATLTVDGKDHFVKISFRGIGFPHWSETKKSLRLEFEPPNSYSGLHKINLSIPQDGLYYGFFLNKWAADYLGLPTNDPAIIHLFLNDHDYGSFITFEQWDQDFFKIHNLPEGPIFGDIDPSPSRPPLYQNIKAWEILNPAIFTADNFFAIETMLQALNNSDLEESISQLKQIIDIDNFVRWEALSIFFNSRHQDSLHNIRLYLNPATNKLQFMPVDFGPQLVNNHPADKTLLNIDYNPLVTRLLQDPDVYQARNDILRDLINNQEFQKKLWQRYDELYYQTRGDFYRDPLKFESDLRFTWVVRQLKSQTKENIKNLQNLLNK